MHRIYAVISFPDKIPSRIKSRKTPWRESPGLSQIPGSRMGTVKACNRVDSTSSVPLILYPLHSVGPQSVSPLGKRGGDAGASLCVCDTRLGLPGLLYASQQTLEAQHVHVTDEETKAGGGKGHAAGRAGELQPNRKLFGALAAAETLQGVGLSGRAGEVASKYLGL